MHQFHTSLLNANHSTNNHLFIHCPPKHHRRNLTIQSSSSSSNHKNNNLVLATSAALLALTLTGVRTSISFAATLPPVVEDSEVVEECENEELKAAFESYKSKTYALTVPLRVVALRNSVPPLWIKNFIQSQGKRVKFRLEFRGTIEDIFSELSKTIGTGNVTSKSAGAADIVSLGDSWVNSAISKKLIEPIEGVDDQDWFHTLSDKWKVYLRRNNEGKSDAQGKIYAVPYRWGSMVIAYRKSKFRQHNLAPIEDWSDLWRPDLAGKITMVDSPREVIGAVLKYLGASYNTSNIDSEVNGGKNAVKDKLVSLTKQVRLFDSANYLKAFTVGDVWVAVGWSSDIVPAAKRMSDVTVIVPKSGASLWADLWAIPAASGVTNDELGGRVRGPSPLIHQWLDFCLQTQRALPFEEEIIAGASPSALDINTPVPKSKNLTKNKPKLDTNLISGVPPPDILTKCEFLEPLSDSTILDYQWLIGSMQIPNNGFMHKLQSFMPWASKGSQTKLM
ncbi:putrescine-binding periplasmic protein-related protein [Artemisia annua]|uniref:Putrescine-binding periplasmic protein-related protein n=1 Tax=Artemisia annua TaxID=35608 RepID=A0A2U1NHV4_ARTAN|nr:putrescine-binding periplasmic protein-related protein [Artemisia annua]